MSPASATVLPASLETTRARADTLFIVVLVGVGVALTSLVIPAVFAMLALPGAPGATTARKVNSPLNPAGRVAMSKTRLRLPAS